MLVNQIVFPMRLNIPKMYQFAQHGAMWHEITVKTSNQTLHF